MACNVCCESFNKSTRKEIQCTTCKYSLCMTCFEHYQSEHSGLYEVSCMNCKQLWESQYVHENVPSAVIKRLTARTKTRLRESEIAYMPESQLYAEYGRKVETLKVNEYLDIVRKQHDAMFALAQNEMKPTKEQVSFIELRKEIKTHKNKAADLSRYIHEWRQHQRLSRHFQDIADPDLYERTFPQSGSTSKDKNPKEKTVNVLCPCPGETCRGFVTRTHNQCGMCNIRLCGKCLQISPKDEDKHECKPDDLESARLVLNSSKPCPKCAVRIQKIEGCDQMWCTQCKTPFSWKTGQEIVGGMIHNPHYYEWARNNGRVNHGFDFNNCEGLPEMRYVSRHIQLVFFRNDDQFPRRAIEVHRKCVHFQQVERRNQTEHDDNFFKNLDIRIRWLNNQISDKQFESVLHRRYKQILVNQRINQVYDLVVTLCSDVFHRILRQNNDTPEIREGFMTEFREIFTYGDSCFAKLEKVYKVKMPRVS